MKSVIRQWCVVVSSQDCHGSILALQLISLYLILLICKMKWLKYPSSMEIVRIQWVNTCKVLTEGPGSGPAFNTFVFVIFILPSWCFMVISAASTVHQVNYWLVLCGLSQNNYGIKTGCCKGEKYWKNSISFIFVRDCKEENPAK